MSQDCATYFRVLILLITLVNLCNGSTHICNDINPCTTQTIDCNPNEECIIKCTSSNACYGKTINCPKDQPCEVHCINSGAISQCENTIINATFSSYLLVNASSKTIETYPKTMQEAHIYCPNNGPHDPNLPSSCHINCEGDDLMRKAKIWAVEGFNDVTITATKYNSLWCYRMGIMYCKHDFNASCAINPQPNDNGFECNTDHICDSHAITHSPTTSSINPTIPPTKTPISSPTISPSNTATTIAPTFNPITISPTNIPSTSPTQYPIGLPSNNPSIAPTIYPTFPPNSSISPTNNPTFSPTINPINNPSMTPSINSPTTSSPTSTNPSVPHIFLPTISINPSIIPTSNPSFPRTFNPTIVPTMMPSTNEPTLSAIIQTSTPTSTPTMSDEHVYESTTDATLPILTIPTDDTQTQFPTVRYVLIMIATAGALICCLIFYYYRKKRKNVNRSLSIVQHELQIMPLESSSGNNDHTVQLERGEQNNLDNDEESSVGHQFYSNHRTVGISVDNIQIEGDEENEILHVNNVTVYH